MFSPDSHLASFRRLVKSIPTPYQTLDANRMTLLYLLSSGMDLLSSLDSLDKTRVIEWIYAQQIPGGFACGPSAGPKTRNSGEPNAYWETHIAMTYSALCVLKIFGDDFSRVDVRGIIDGLREFRMLNGCFRSLPRPSEEDMRFIYCACVISSMLEDWSGVDLDTTTEFILQCQAWDGAFGMQIGQEAHGGSTFCAVASLALMGRLDAIPKGRRRELLVKWCLDRQGAGFHGRPHKPNDTCYSWWIGASLTILGGELVFFLFELNSLAYHWTKPEGNLAFNLSCSSKFGGFSKEPESFPDIMHSYFGLAGVSLMGEESLQRIYPLWGLTTRAAAKSYSPPKTLEEWLSER